MFTIDTKAIRYEYYNLAKQVNNLNCNPLDLDLITRAKQISGNDIVQVFSERHGRVINTMTKVVGNVTFIIILVETNDTLELSPYIHIKEPNGKIVLTWNIKDETITFIPNNV